MTTTLEFKEIKRLRISDSTELILSEAYRGKDLRGYSISKYIISEKYTGYSRGIFIPEDLLYEFLKLFPKEDLKLASED